MKEPNAISLLRLQAVIATAFIFIGIWFPFYICHKYGSQTLPIYNRFGVPIGEASYFFLSIGVGLLTIAIGSLGAGMALKELAKTKVNKDTHHSP